MRDIFSLCNDAIDHLDNQIQVKEVFKALEKRMSIVTVIVDTNDQLRMKYH